jgi:membrane-associated phospholipid phosphatase
MISVALSLLLATSTPLPLPEPAAHSLKSAPLRDGLLLGSLAVIDLTTEVALKGVFAPQTCRWCAPNALDSAGRSIRWQAPDTADALSNWLMFAILPVSIVGTTYFAERHDQASAFFVEDLVGIAQGMMFARVATQLTKFIAGRERPFVHALPSGLKGLTRHPTDNNLSFFSGHSSTAFSLLFAAGSIAELRGYRARGWIWGVGLPLALAMPLLRMGADRHYLTDVLVGAAVGAAAGWFVPRWLHPRLPGSTANQLSIAPVPEGAMIRWGVVLP